MVTSQYLCTARGPAGEHCWELPGHDYAHYDGSEDISWTDRTEDHRLGCQCDQHRPDLYNKQGVKPL